MTLKPDPWRYRCPNGHTDIIKRVGNGSSHGPRAQSRYYCRQCDDPHYDHLIDAKTGNKVTQ